MSKSPTKRGQKRVAFYARLPVGTVSEIKRRTHILKPQWAVVVDAVEATKGSR